jgi:hypothetical protein
MNKIALTIACIALCTAQTVPVRAQAVSSGMISGSGHHRDLHVRQTMRTVRPAHPTAVASRRTSDPVTTGSITAPKN